jgi:hypothetical protein
MWAFLVVLLLLIWLFSVKEGIDDAVSGYEKGLSIVELKSKVEMSQTRINEPKVDILQQLTDKQNDQLANIKSMIATIKAQQDANKPDTKIPA